MTSVTAFGVTIVTLHTYEKAVELLDKKSLIYSSRPVIPMLHLAGWTDNVAFIPYGSQLKECKRMLRSELSSDKISAYFPEEEAVTHRFVQALEKSPEQFYERAEW